MCIIVKRLEEEEAERRQWPSLQMVGVADSKELSMKQVSEGVYYIEGQDEMIPDAHMYVIGKQESRDISIIDAGLVGKGDYKVNAMLAAGIDLDSVQRVILTHTHFDHVGCLSEIREHIPQAELWVHANEAQSLEDGDDRIVFGMDMFKSMCMAQYAIGPGAFRFHVDKTLHGGEHVDLGGMEWEILFIPGHSPGSIGFYNRAGKILIPGDVVYSDYAIGRFDLYKADGSDLRDSLLKLSALDVRILLPGHNRIITDLPDGYIKNTLKQWEQYLL